MRIIHFSDIHAGGWVGNLSGYFDKRLIGAFNYLIRRKCIHNWRLVDKAVAKIEQLEADVVVCTGDLTSISEPREFAMARDALRPLVENRQFDLIYVPGNHDNYVRNSRCQQSLHETFHFVNRGKWTLEQLPLYYDIGPIRFLIINQAIPVSLFLSSGLIDAKANDWLRENLSLPSWTDVQKIVLIGHFPLYDKRGNDLARRRRCMYNTVLQKAYRDGIVKLSLCGHIHREFIRRDNHGSVEICAGSLTYTGKLNVIDYDTEGNTVGQHWVAVD